MNYVTTKAEAARRRFIKRSVTIAAVIGTLVFCGWIAGGKSETPSYKSERATYSPYVETPTQPIAIVINRSQDTSFGKYLGELLLAEGVNAFQFIDLKALDDAQLLSFAAILLPPTSLLPAQVELLTRYVAQGGILIAMRPDRVLAPLLGLLPAEGVTIEGYMAVREGNGIALQIHSKAAHYTPNGATTVADLYRDRSTPTGFPALTIYKHERGRAVMFAYDLPENIALTRQGNPAIADQERDGLEGIRASDMFVGWLDLDNIVTPQADLQTRLLAKITEDVLSDRLPLPRLWYFPNGARSIILLTGDAHSARGTFIEETLKTAESYDGRVSVYYSPPRDNAMTNAARRWLGPLVALARGAPDRAGRPTPEEVRSWQARGHEFSIHPYIEDDVDTSIEKYLRLFARNGYDAVSATLRTHKIQWTGWAESARAHAKHGFRMNFDSYHVGPAFQKADGSWPVGHFIGSGLPMKFVDEKGSLIGVYQQPTQLVDEHLLATSNPVWAGLDGSQAAQASRDLIDRSVNGDYAALAVQYHMDFTSSDEPHYQNAHRWLVGILDYAHEKALPIWSAQRWLMFVESRRDVAFRNMRWDKASSTLLFELNVPSTISKLLNVLMPAKSSRYRFHSVKQDGRQVPAQSSSPIAGREYYRFTVESGVHSFAIRYTKVR